MITGKIFFRNPAIPSGITLPDGKKLVVAVSIMAVPEHIDTDEKMYILTGNDKKDIELTIHKDSITEVSDETRGESIAGVVCKPIWQI